MSLNSKVIKALDQVRDEFILAVADKYQLNAVDLAQLWDKDTKAPVKKTATVVKSDTDQKSASASPAEAELNKLSKGELVELCKAKNLRYSGTKAKLISFLLGEDSDSPTPAKKTPAPKVAKGGNTDVAKKLTASTPVVSIRRNKHGNHCHAETGLVFNKTTMKAVGHQSEDGKVIPLNDEDIENCNRFKFPYDLPDNLDAGSTLDTEKVNELDDDGDEDEGELDEEEELDEEGLVLDDDGEEDEYVDGDEEFDEEDEEFDEEEED